MMVAGVLGLKPEQVKLNMLYAGGSFGRRANPQSDYLVETATIVKAINGRAPVKLVWTREDDTRAGFYRPLYYHALRGGLDAQGNIVGWHHRIVGQSILAGTAFESMMVKDGIDATSVEGASTLPYAIGNLAVRLHTSSSRCLCSGGVGGARRIPRIRPRCSSTSLPWPLARIRTRCAARSSISIRATGSARGSSREGRLEQAMAKGGAGGVAAAESRCTSRSTPLSRRWPRSR
jgi:hypothetical protein